MAETRVYHWKHGFIPLDHEAALSKAHGSEKGAAALLHGVRRDHLRREPHIDAVAKGHRVALQDHKTGHTISVDNAHAATLHSQGHTITAVHDGSFSTRDDYGHVHTFDRNGQNVTADTALPHGYKITEDTISSAPGHSQGTGRYSFTDAQGSLHYVGGSKVVATRRANDHAKMAEQKEAARKSIVAERAARDRAAAAEHDRIRAIKIDLASTITDEDRKLVQKSNALHAGNPQYVNENDLRGIIASKSPHISADSKTLARKELDNRGYQSAKSRLSSKTDTELRALRGKIASSSLSAHEKAGAAKYIRERLRN